MTSNRSNSFSTVPSNTRMQNLSNDNASSKRSLSVIGVNDYLDRIKQDEPNNEHNKTNYNVDNDNNNNNNSESEKTKQQLLLLLRSRRLPAPLRLLFTSCRKLQEENINLKQQLLKQVAVRKAGKQVVPKAANYNNELSNELVQLHTQIEKLKEELAASYKQNSLQAKHLFQYMEEASNAKKEVAAAQEETTTLQHKVEELAAQHTILQSRLARTEGSFDHLKDEHAALQETAKQLENQIKEERNSTRNLYKQIDSYKEAVKEYAQREEQLVLQLNHSVELVNNMNDELMKLERLRITKANNSSQTNDNNSSNNNSMQQTELSTAPSQELLDKLLTPASYWQPPVSWHRNIENAHNDHILSVCYNMGGNLLATGSMDCTVKLWNSFTSSLIKTLKGPTQSVLSVSISLDNEFILGSSVDKAIYVWSEDGLLRHTLNGHSKKVSSAAFLKSRIASGSHDRTIKLWDLQRSCCVSTLPCASICNDLCVSGIGYFVSAHYDKAVRIFDANSLNLAHTLKIGHSGQVTSVCHSEDACYILTNSRDNTLKLVDMRTMAVLRTFKHAQYRNGADHNRAVFSHDGKYVVAGGADGQVFLWERDDGRIWKVLPSQGNVVSCVAAAQSGSQMAVVHHNKTITLWEH